MLESPNQTVPRSCLGGAWLLGRSQAEVGERLHSRAEVALQDQGGTGTAVGLIWELGILAERVAWGCHGLRTVTGNPQAPLLNQLVSRPSSYWAITPGATSSQPLLPFGCLHFLLDRVSCNPGWPQTHSPGPLASGVIGVHYHFQFTECRGQRVKPRASCTLGKHSTDSAMPHPTPHPIKLAWGEMHAYLQAIISENIFGKCAILIWKSISALQEAKWRVLSLFVFLNPTQRSEVKTVNLRILKTRCCSAFL